MLPPKFWRRAPGETVWQATLLQPAACAWGIAGRLRRRWTAPVRIEAPVLCVGNLVMGGAGKTPAAIAFARAALARKLAPCFLTRGYGGRLAGPVLVDPARHDAGDVGDEAMLLAEIAPTWVSRDRAAGGRAAVAAGADLVVMDDGFQNPRLRKDQSAVVIDSIYRCGNGRVFPAGPLREPVQDGLSRADWLVVVGDEYDAAVQIVQDAWPFPDDLILRARIGPADALDLPRGRRIAGFAGIGRPEKFFRTLQEAGLEIAWTRGFPDHHVYSAGDLADLRKAATEAGAQLATTAKDHVRLPPPAREEILRIDVTMTFADPKDPGRVIDATVEEYGG